MGLASAMGVSFQEVGASIATYTRVGVDSAMATNDLAATLRGFLQPSQQAEVAATAMGVSFEDFRATIKEKGLKAALDDVMKATGGNVEQLTALFTSAEAVRGVLGTVGTQGEAYADILRDMGNATGLVDEGFKAVAETAQFKFDAALSALSSTGVIIGSALLPVITALADGVASVATWFQGLDANAQSMVLVLVGLAAAIGPVLWGVGVLTTAMTTLSIAVNSAAWPIALVVAGIAAVVAAVAAVIIYWDEIVFHLESSWLLFKAGFLTTASLILTGVEGFINSALDIIRPLAEFIGVDVPANVSLGGAALAQAALDTRGELAALEQKHKDAKDESARMRDEIGSAIPTPPVAGAVGELEEVETAANNTTTATGGVSSSIITVEEEYKRIGGAGGPLVKIATSFETIKTNADGANKSTTEVTGSTYALGTAIGTNLLHFSEMASKVEKWGVQSIQVNSAMASAPARIKAMDQPLRTLSDNLTDTSEAQQELLDKFAPSKLTVFNDMVSQINAPGGVLASFASLTQAISGGGGVGGALLGIAGQVPGIGTAITGISETLGLFGLDMGTILDGVIKGLGQLLGLSGGASQAEQMTQTINDLMDRILSGQMSGDEATTAFQAFINQLQSSTIAGQRINDTQATAFMAQFIDALRATRFTGDALEEEIQQITGLDNLVDAVNSGYMTVEEAFSELLLVMNAFQETADGWRLTNEEESDVVQRFLESFTGWNPFWGWSPGMGPGSSQPSSIPVEGNESSYTQIINMNMDGKLIAQAMIQNAPEVLDLYGLA
jgi:hypothetical protein